MNQKETHHGTILAMVTGFLVLFYFFESPWMLYVSLILGVTGILSPFLARNIHWLWMKIGHILGWVNSKILLGIVFYIILFPVALIAKSFRKDLLKIKRGTRTSTFEERNHTYVPEDLKFPF